MENDDSRGTIVCSHVANDDLPILSAVRAEPANAANSGWHFLCGSDREHRDDDGQQWSVADVLEVEHEFRRFLKLPPGTRLKRRGPETPWVNVFRN